VLTRYRPDSGSFDELYDADGLMRPAWSHVGPALHELGHNELLRRQSDVDRLLDADGVSYNALGSTDPRGRRWALDPVPVVLSSAEWAVIEAGLIDRAELLDLILADLYGPRDLIRRGLLPGEFVFSHPGFLRACDQIGAGARPTSRLVTYAADIARDESGRFVAISDRAQAPSGAGYALENRVVISRVFPSLYRDAQVHRLAPFFRSLRSALRECAPASSPNRHDPRVVVLTPGPWSETAFEHAYLASYLGYSLVQGGDLVARGGRIWMRSLGRLEPVDVILRRVDDWFCDPLELRPDSQLGVPGLLDAARRGTVAIVNPLGSGIVESPALLAFLPAIAEHLTGRELRLPSVQTWWCGDDASRAHVLANLSTLVIKPVARGVGHGTILGWEQSSDDLEQLRARITTSPYEWCAQAAVSMSTTPTLTADGFAARPSVLRTFAVARASSYVVMPGGLLRVAPDTSGALISNQSGALTKDAWVLASEPEKPTSYWLQSGPTVEAADPVGSMPSRAAENLFWLGRYAERAEDVVRLLRVIYDRRTEFASGTNPAGARCLDMLLRALTDVTTAYPGFLAESARESPGSELFALIVDDTRAGTLAHAVHRLLDAAYAVRDQLSNDTWLVIGNLDREILALRDEGGSPASEHPVTVQKALGSAMHSLLAFAGLASESMVRDPGWHFMDAGRRLERGLQLATLLRTTLRSTNDTATDSLLLESVLTTAESIITYRRRYRSQAQVETVLDLLLLDAGNPRSLVFQLDRLAADVAQLPAHEVDPARERLSPVAKLVLETTTALHLADTGVLASPDVNGDRPQLDEFLGRIEALLQRCAAAVESSHFTPQLPQRAMSLDARLSATAS
jgi:uncharacterized circularly permuted ATP-grasp superfamily protein/uncharacterized alpha-E superfamily protein